MFTGILKRFLKQTAILTAALTTASVLMVLGMTNAHAAATCSISTIPANATIDEGQSIDFAGSISGKGKKTCDWTFDGGVPASATSDCSLSVSYASAGSYIARLDGTASKENPSTCS